MQLQTILSSTLLLVACTASLAVAVPVDTLESPASPALRAPEPETLDSVPVQVCAVDFDFPLDIHTLRGRV